MKECASASHQGPGEGVPLGNESTVPPLTYGRPKSPLYPASQDEGRSAQRHAHPAVDIVSRTTATSTYLVQVKLGSGYILVKMKKPWRAGDAGPLATAGCRRGDALG